MSTVVILLGAPGAGKGTQAIRLSSALGLPHVSTGDLFRANLKQGTELGARAKAFMNAGKLVPDDLVLEMLFDRVAAPDCEGGYLLDGFPRTVPQAEALDARLGDDSNLVVLNIEVPDDKVVARISGRRLCRACGNIQHVLFAAPKVEGVCDACGGELYQREDDHEDVVGERLAEYRRLTLPLVEYYGGARRVLHSVDGDRTPDEVFASLLAFLADGSSTTNIASGRAKG